MLGIPEPEDSSPLVNGTRNKRYGGERITPVREWEGANGDYSSDEDHIDPHRRYGYDDDEEEESRYTRQPPRKRRRMDTEADYHTVYTTDEDEDERGLFADPHVDLRVRPDGERFSGRKQRDDRNRTYWLAKGLSKLD
jgi:hypothetical protein